MPFLAKNCKSEGVSGSDISLRTSSIGAVQTTCAVQHPKMRLSRETRYATAPLDPAFRGPLHLALRGGHVAPGGNGVQNATVMQRSVDRP